MEYSDLMKEVEIIFKNKLNQLIPNSQTHDIAGHQITLNVIYTEIMALGYNFGNVDKAVADLVAIYGKKKHYCMKSC